MAPLRRSRAAKAGGVSPAQAAEGASWAANAALPSMPRMAATPAASQARVDDLGDLKSLEVVYLLDFAGPPGFAHDLAAKARSVVVLDHHKTSAASLLEPGACPSNLSPIFDFGRSGATIALDYFTKRLRVEGLGSDLVAEKDIERLRRLFACIEDADLWSWQLTGSKAFTSGLNDLQLEYDANKNPEIFNQLQALVPEDVIAIGKKIMLPRQKQIDGALGASFTINLGQGTFGSCLVHISFAVRVDDALSRLRSAIGHELAEKSKKAGLRGIGAVVYVVPHLQDSSMLKVSLRSLDEIEENTTPISEAYGGGGHRAASSFMIATDAFDCWIARPANCILSHMFITGDIKGQDIESPLLRLMGKMYGEA
eukprot:SM000011S19106  [mRNA]  locus=s11:879278:883083:+ [translate_table: standard]